MVVESNKAVSRKGNKRKLDKSIVEDDDKLVETVAPVEVKKRKKEEKPISKRAKAMWEVIRKEECPESDRSTLIDELLKHVNGQIKSIIRAHDTVRVIETVIKLGSNEQRTTVYNEVKDIIVELSKSKYAKFFVLKMLANGTKAQKNEIVESFHGHIVKLTKNALACQVLEYIYTDVANAKQRMLMAQEFYGASFGLFKDNEVKCLRDVIKASPALRNRIMNQFKSQLTTLVNKESIKLNFVHYLIRQYYINADESEKREMTERIRDSVVEILHTKDGARVALHCIWSGNAKDRKVILKGFKKMIDKIAREEYGHMVLLAVFDSVDDTKLIEKAIINELFSSNTVVELAQNKYALKVFEYLVSPRDSRFFHKDIIEILKEGDNNTTSKKDRNVRETELKTMATPHLFKLIVNHVGELIKNNGSCLLMQNILHLDTHEDLRMKAIKCLASTLAAEGAYSGPKTENSDDGEKLHMIENGGTHFIFKKLVKSDANRKNDDLFTFSEAFVECIAEEIIASYTNCNKGCFLLLNLMETNIPKVVQKLTKILVPVVKRKQFPMTFKGAELIKQAVINANGK